MAEGVVKENIGFTPSEKARIYKSKILRAIEQVVIEEDQPPIIAESFVDLCTQGKSKYERTVAALRIVGQFTPQVAVEKIKERYAYKQDLMPVNPNDYSLKERKVGSGGINDVFLLQAKTPKALSYVLKVNRCGGRAVETQDLVSLAKDQREEYEKISRVYRNIPDLIPEEYHLVMHGPRMEEAVAVVIQPFIGEKIRDVFEDFEKDELLNLLQENKHLANQMSEFVKATKADKLLIKNELDLLGKNNLAIAGDKGNERLLLLDPHFRSRPSRGIDTRNAIEERLNYIGELCEVVS